MNLSISEGEQLVNEVLSKLPSLKPNQHVVFCGPFTHLDRLSGVLKNQSSASIHLGAQNCHDKVSGAYTGEISISMLKELNVDTVIIGHSERRQYFQESNEFLKSKVNALVEANMHVLFCCGEPLSIREAGTQNAFVEKQLEESLFHLSGDQMMSSITIAYEPIWAIGSGKIPQLLEIEAVHAYIKSVLGSSTPVLYGGSVNSTNAEASVAWPHRSASSTGVNQRMR